MFNRKMIPLTVDGIFFINGSLILIKRKNDPYKGQLALPGGFVDYGETTEHAVIREVKEETGMIVSNPKLIGVFDNPKRDPRGHIVSIAYLVEPIGGILKADDDAIAIKLVDENNISSFDLAFDHKAIIAKALYVRNSEKTWGR